MDEDTLRNFPWVEPPFTGDYGYKIELGDGVFINFNCIIVDTCKVTIGSRTLFGPSVSLYSGTHPTDSAIRHGLQGPELGKEIHIGEDCWIGGNVIVLPGVTIGKGSTVGAGSVVTKDVPPYTVVAGNPARVVRRLKADVDTGENERRVVKEESATALLRRMEKLEEEMREVKEKLVAMQS